MSKCAVITGATGQDGSYLTEFLLSKPEYSKIFCIVRRTTYLIQNSSLSQSVLENSKIKIMNGDLLDQPSLSKVFEEAKNFDTIEVYNLAAQSDVGVSFKCPKATGEVNYLGTLNLLETIKQTDIIPKTKLYHASTSEMFGKVQEVPQKETTPFYPRSPYGVAKLAAHWIVKNYRESYDLFACCGILFNHESPRRGIGFVTQKVVRGIRDVLSGKQKVLEVGNLDAKRDWGHAKDYVRAMWLMLQQETPDDYIVGTGKQHSVRDFIEKVLCYYDVQIQWEGTGLNEVGKNALTNQVIVKVSEEFYRPCEVDTLIANPTKIKSIGWNPDYTFEDLIGDMIGKDKKILI